MVKLAVDCPSCHRELASSYHETLWGFTNCPYCMAPLQPAEDEDGFYFSTEAPWL